MSLIAEIGTEKNKIVWCKSILSLCLITDDIQFILRSDSLTVKGVNTTLTNTAEIIFDKLFFQDYELNFDKCIEEGYDRRHKTYSFVVSSLVLSILFKSFESHSVLVIKIKLNDSFKAFIDIERNLIVKKYQINYQPIKYHHDSFTRNQSKLLVMEQSVLKEFIDMVPVKTEEFKIEIKDSKIIFNGFTKQVIKDNQYLKQPMSTTISLSLDDVIDTNVPSDYNQLISFKLRFFKIFINLVWLILAGGSDRFDIYFTEPGAPILFTFNDSVKVNFTQLTNDESGETDGTGHTFKSYELEPTSKAIRRSVIESRQSTMSATEDLDREIDQIPLDYDDEYEGEFAATQLDEVKSIFD